MSVAQEEMAGVDDAVISNIWVNVIIYLELATWLASHPGWLPAQLAYIKYSLES